MEKGLEEEMKRSEIGNGERGGWGFREGRGKGDGDWREWKSGKDEMKSSFSRLRFLGGTKG